MATRKTFFGRKDGAFAYEVGVGQLDGEGTTDGTTPAEPIRPRFETPDILPAGIGGEAVFHRLFLTVTSDMDVTVVVTPIVDGVAHDTAFPSDTVLPAEVDLSAETSPEKQTFEIDLTVPHYATDGVTELWRNAMRGQSLAVHVAVDDSGLGSSGVLIFEGLELDREIVHEGRQAANAA